MSASISWFSRWEAKWRRHSLPAVFYAVRMCLYIATCVCLKQTEIGFDAKEPMLFTPHRHVHAFSIVYVRTHHMQHIYYTVYTDSVSLPMYIFSISYFKSFISNEMNTHCRNKSFERKITIELNALLFSKIKTLLLCFILQNKPSNSHSSVLFKQKFI